MRPSRTRINLVTGATGFCASHLIKILLARGERVIGTDLPAMLADTERRWVLERIDFPFDHPNLTLVGADLLKPETLAPLFDEPLTHVYHTASLYNYSASLELLRRINVEGTNNLLALAVGANLTRFIHWSTCGVFGKPFTTKHGARVNIPFTESSSSPKNRAFGVDSPEGTWIPNDYSISKWEQEQFVWRAHREQGLPLTVIRPGPMYGPGSVYGHGGIVLLVARGLVRVIPRDAHNYINASVHVEDVARFAVFAADREEAAGEDYNVVDSSIISQAEFMHYIGLLTGRKIRESPFVSIKTAGWLMRRIVKIWMWLERKYGVRRLRLAEPGSVEYVAASYWLSNRKSIEAGFEYQYADVRAGLVDTVTWLREIKWLFAPDEATRRKLLLAPARGREEEEDHASKPNGSDRGGLPGPRRARSMGEPAGRR